MADDRLRIDKWLWFARVAKTRTLAQKLVLSGRVRINSLKNDSAAHPVKIGDVLTIAFDRNVRILKITAMASRRGPAVEAQQLYDDLSPPPASRPARETNAAREPGSGRPTKRQRRLLHSFRGDDAWSGDDFPSDSG